ncbi:DUF397 domain-containing protein [Saccharopolyspora phatthalungensis]|uniref:DUF397 domain-containing protein n=1 Tax=Saccharopolyspora phatthalungensis TaxID=664693 RepID=A0A840PQQ9_9PSEU|nr:DUF397 domain-containing protein [Saccharopolyspora phatthalungensis]MBB5152642.1 hypothetical protein [Saccharopolyspora phatthalungensis]
MTAQRREVSAWKKSSYSANNGDCVEVAFVTFNGVPGWRKSSYSANNGECVEVALTDEVVGARDSKNPGGPELWFRGARWGRFVAAVKAGRFDLV